MRLSISEILEKASKLSKNQEKIDFLRQNYNQPLGIVLQHAFDPNIKFVLPEGAPPYTPNKVTGQETRLYSETRKFYLFIDTCTKNINKARKEALFIEMLENVDPKDAILLIAMKDKKLPYKGITAKLIKEAYPGLIKEDQKENEQVS